MFEEKQRKKSELQRKIKVKMNSSVSLLRASSVTFMYVFVIKLGKNQVTKIQFLPYSISCHVCYVTV